MALMFAPTKIRAVEKVGGQSRFERSLVRSMTENSLSRRQVWSEPANAGSEVDGNPLAFKLTSGDVHDITPAPELLAKARSKYFIADKAYDSDAFVEAIECKNMIAVIPSRSARVEPRSLNTYQYKERHLVENCFAKLKLGFPAPSVRWFAPCWAASLLVTKKQPATFLASWCLRRFASGLLELDVRVALLDNSAL
jgi:transposase